MVDPPGNDLRASAALAGFNRLIWTVVGALGAITMYFFISGSAGQQSQVTATAAAEASNGNRITALEVQVRQLQDQYSVINNKLDSISQRQLQAPAGTQR